MSNPVLLVTGAAGLVGSEAVRYFAALGWEVHGVDNNMRADFFGPDGDTTANLLRLKRDVPGLRHYALDIRDRAGVIALLDSVRPAMIVHAAAQPSHDLAAKRPFDDFDVNAVGTLNVLEACRQHCRDAVFCFLSTNKVYGDAPNELPLIELSTRWDFERPEDVLGIAESLRIDRSKHSLFGASKAAADILVQEYGRYFDMKTVCLRGGCLTGGAHSASELHGFLAFLVKACAEGRTYRIFGYKGKQVRDNIHAYDVCAFMHQFYLNPKCGEVYNIGGGRENSVSVLEAIDRTEQVLDRRLATEYVDRARDGDHICYITDLRKAKADFPQWSVTRSLDDIFLEIAGAGPAQNGLVARSG